ncbi:MAG: uracil-DNA glycosylase [Deltaproteobacteria bacterium]|nr:uracil-DNA glycosylase [Deltaproteobacteria bacterium]
MRFLRDHADLRQLPRRRQRSGVRVRDTRQDRSPATRHDRTRHRQDQGRKRRDPEFDRCRPVDPGNQARLRPTRWQGLGVDPALTTEACSLLASARATLKELAEEGVDQFDPLNDTAAASPPRLDVPAAQEPTRNVAQVQAKTKVQTLEEVRLELGECTRCPLCEGRNQIVFGDGNPDAALMFIGEGPGQEEDRRGLPFVGRAGELLTQMIEGGLEIPRSEVYICNIVKCRPPKNRTPQPDEVATCKPFLDGQISAVRPRTIVTLGRPAASLLLGRDVSITRVRGTWHEYQGIPLMPTFHPAYLLRQYTVENRTAVWEDLKAALARSRQ